MMRDPMKFDSFPGLTYLNILCAVGRHVPKYVADCGDILQYSTCSQIEPMRSLNFPRLGSQRGDRDDISADVS